MMFLPRISIFTCIFFYLFILGQATGVRQTCKQCKYKFKNSFPKKFTATCSCPQTSQGTSVFNVAPKIRSCVRSCFANFQGETCNPAGPTTTIPGIFKACCRSCDGKAVIHHFPGNKVFKDRCSLEGQITKLDPLPGFDFIPGQTRKFAAIVLKNNLQRILNRTSPHYRVSAITKISVSEFLRLAGILSMKDWSHGSNAPSTRFEVDSLYRGAAFYGYGCFGDSCGTLVMVKKKNISKEKAVEEALIVLQRIPGFSNYFVTDLSKIKIIYKHGAKYVLFPHTVRI